MGYYTVLEDDSSDYSDDCYQQNPIKVLDHSNNKIKEQDLSLMPHYDDQMGFVFNEKLKNKLSIDSQELLSTEDSTNSCKVSKIFATLNHDECIPESSFPILKKPTRGRPKKEKKASPKTRQQKSRDIKKVQEEKNLASHIKKAKETSLKVKDIEDKNWDHMVKTFCPQSVKKCTQKKITKPKRLRYTASQNYKGLISRALARFAIDLQPNGKSRIENISDLPEYCRDIHLKKMLIIYINEHFKGKKVDKKDCSKVNNSEECQKVFLMQTSDTEDLKKIKSVLRILIIEFFSYGVYVNFWLKNSKMCNCNEPNKAWFLSNRAMLFKYWMGEIQECKFSNPTEQELAEFHKIINPDDFISY